MSRLGDREIRDRLRKIRRGQQGLVTGDELGALVDLGMIEVRGGASVLTQRGDDQLDLWVRAVYDRQPVATGA